MIDTSVQIAIVSAISTVAVAGFGVIVTLINRNNASTKENTAITKQGVLAAQENTKVANQAVVIAANAVSAAKVAVTESTAKVEEVHNLVNGHYTNMQADLKEMRIAVTESTKNLATAMQRIQELQNQITTGKEAA